MLAGSYFFYPGLDVAEVTKVRFRETREPPLRTSALPGTWLRSRNSAALLLAPALQHIPPTDEGVRDLEIVGEADEVRIGAHLQDTLARFHA